MPSNQRLNGLDLARGLAVVGMVFVNFTYVFSHDHINRIIKDSAAILEYSPLGISVAAISLLGFAGRAVAVFLVLFGIGLMLQAKRAGFRISREWPASSLKRYFVLAITGMVFVPLWEADILHYIGIFGFLALMLVRLPTSWLMVVGVAVLVGAELLRMQFNYPTGWEAGAIGSHYEDLWSLGGIGRQLFFNGYHPVFPWLGFVIYGMVLGRLDLRNHRLLRRLVGAGVLLAAAGFVAQVCGVPADFFPADTLFVLLGMANATWIIAACLLAGFRPRPSWLRGAMQDMGRLALSHYPGHVLLVIVPLMIVRREQMDLSFEGSFLASVIYLVVTAVLGRYWLQHNRQGPLERLLRLVSQQRLFRRRSPGWISGKPTE